MALAVAASAFLAAASVRCEEQEAPPPAGYGAQIGGLDLLSATGLLLAGATGSGPVAYASLGVFVLGGPIVHLAHGRPGTGVASLAVRVLLPAGLGYLGGLIGSGARCALDDCSFSVIGGAAIGVLVGGIAASLVDGLVFAKEPAPAPAPRVGFVYTGRGLALAGRF